MPARRILQLGDPLLREISSAVANPEQECQTFGDLRATLHEFRRTHGFGRGISAVQIGETKRLIYIEFDGTAFQIANPTFEHLSEETFELWDDCFSFPNLLVRLRRSCSCRLQYLDEKGTQQVLECEGALSELVQHEMDHLDGILAIDRAPDKHSFATREEYERRFRRGAAG
jgi:peptide deformylase